MKYERIPTRRQTSRKRMFARLFNQPKTKKQHAAAAAPAADEMEESGINISRSLTIIFAIHIVAIGMIFFHQQFLSGRTQAPAGTDSSSSPDTVAAVVTPAATQQNNHLPVLSSGDKPYMVKKGDNYSVIAAKHNVEESILREMNRGADIRPGVVLRIPPGKRIVAEAPPEVAAIRNQAPASAADLGLVEILPPVEAETSAPNDTAQLIRPAVNEIREEEIPRAEPVASGRTHTVKSGDNIWRISNKYKVSQQELMAINKITDPTKLKIGQTLKLP